LALSAALPTAVVALSAALLTAAVGAVFDDEFDCFREPDDLLVEPRERAWGFFEPADRFDEALVLV
jgi:hypothetical protein